MHPDYPELVAWATPSSATLPSAKSLTAKTQPELPKESQAVGLVAFQLAEDLTDLYLLASTPNSHLEHPADHQKLVHHPCHSRLFDTTGSLLQAPVASAFLSQKLLLPPASPVFESLQLPTQLGPPLGFLPHDQLPREPGSPQDQQVSQDPGSPMQRPLPQEQGSPPEREPSSPQQ